MKTAVSVTGQMKKLGLACGTGAVFQREWPPMTLDT
jgi:hypothetical protein